MSNALAIASVTAVLKDLLNNGVIDHQLSGVVGEVTVSALPPDRVLLEGQAETSRINLFMYQATPNQGWRNAGLPSHDSSGERTSNPPLGIDLHYLVTTYGASEFHAEILLGYALQLLHENPVITRDAIRRTLAPQPAVDGRILPPPYDTLAASELADQVEQVRLTPVAMGTEELSKLWAAIQSHYRPTAAYQATAVIIESKRSARSALPVANDRRNIYVMPFRHPTIEALESSDGARAPIVYGSTLEIRGHDLLADRTFVNVDGTEVLVRPTSAKSDNLSIPLAAAAFPSLQSGVRAVQVVHRIPMGEGAPPADHRGVESNVSAFVLRPSLVTAPVPAGITSSTEGVAPNQVDYRAGWVRIELSPHVGRDQRVRMLLNEIGAPASRSPHAYGYDDPAHHHLADDIPNTAVLNVPFQHVVAGRYLLRVQVDGAESQLHQDAQGVYDSPMVDLQ